MNDIEVLQLLNSEMDRWHAAGQPIDMSDYGVATEDGKWVLANTGDFLAVGPCPVCAIGAVMLGKDLQTHRRLALGVIDNFAAMVQRTYDFAYGVSSGTLGMQDRKINSQYTQEDLETNAGRQVGRAARQYAIQQGYIQPDKEFHAPD